MSTTSFKSPRHKLVKFFEESRDGWKERAQDYYQRIRALEIRVRDLEASRDNWRKRALARQAEEAHRGHEPPQVATIARRSATTDPGC